MRPLRWVHEITREVVALARNYRHAAVLRRHLRSKYGVRVAVGRDVFVGEVLAAIEHAPWSRLVVLAALLIAAVRVRV